MSDETIRLEDIRARVEGAKQAFVPALSIPREELEAILDAVDGVLALAERWRYKGEFGWGAWQEGYGPDPEGWALDNASGEIRKTISATLDPQS